MEQQLTDAQQVAVCSETETETDKNPSKSDFFFVKIVFDLMYLDPNVFLGEMMEWGENSKLWLKKLEKMFGLRLRNAMC